MIPSCIVYVFPEPVWPYAKSVTLVPASASSNSSGTPNSSNAASCPCSAETQESKKENSLVVSAWGRSSRVAGAGRTTLTDPPSMAMHSSFPRARSVSLMGLTRVTTRILLFFESQDGVSMEGGAERRPMRRPLVGPRSGVGGGLRRVDWALPVTAPNRGDLFDLGSFPEYETAEAMTRGPRPMARSISASKGPAPLDRSSGGYSGGGGDGSACNFFFGAGGGGMAPRRARWVRPSISPRLSADDAKGARRRQGWGGTEMRRVALGCEHFRTGDPQD